MFAFGFSYGGLCQGFIGKWVPFSKSRLGLRAPASEVISKVCVSYMGLQNKWTQPETDPKPKRWFRKKKQQLDIQAPTIHIKILLTLASSVDGNGTGCFHHPSQGNTLLRGKNSRYYND